MKPLALQKQLLITESELNRAQLTQEWQAMTEEVHSIVHQAGTISSLVSAAATLVAGLPSFRHQKSAPTAEKPSWLQTLLKGAGILSTVWQSFRPQDRSQKDK
jgi:hypothetical protein